MKHRIYFLISLLCQELRNVSEKFFLSYWINGQAFRTNKQARFILTGVWI